MKIQRVFGQLEAGTEERKKANAQPMCTIKSVCQNTTWSFSERSSPRWLSLETKQCIDFRSVKPDRLPYNSIAMVELVINQLPQLPYGAHYLCVFGDSAPITARVTHNGLACMSPLVGARPPLPPGQDHVVVDLAVRSSETETDFIHRPFWYYECSVHRTCKSCVTSTWACSWCAHENLCTNNASLCKRRVIIGESNPQNSLIKGRQHCPSFNLDDDLLVPNGVRREIAIGVKNLLTPMVRSFRPQPRRLFCGMNDGFQCVVEIEGAKEVVFAKIQDNVVLCAENIYNYQQEVGELQASLTVLWNGDTFIDKTNGYFLYYKSLTIYKCHLLGSHGSREDCSLCQTRDRKYHCSWCGGSCSFGDSCVEPVANSCPPPHIDLIHPLSGPVEGGTLVVIEGSNLGSSAEEIRDKITIGGIPCEPVDYSVSVRVVCKTGPSAAGPLLGVITVGNRAGVTRAQEKFFYKAVELSGVFPQLGPQSGGTRLYLNGTHLNVGSSVEVYLDDMPCTVERSLASSSQVTCRTSPSPRPNYAVRRLVMRIDGANLTFPRPFSYTPDPTISSVHPLTTFLNGGRTIWVKGTHLNSIQQPRLIISHQGEVLNETATAVSNECMLWQVCQVVHPGAMRCLTPAVQASSPPLAAQLLFLLDGLELRPPAAPLLSYVPDPSLASFTGPGGIKLYKGESLVIEGHRLRQASSEAEVSVTIGTRPCNLTSLTSSQLVCLPPEIQPPGTDETARRTASGLPAVVVRVGPNLRYEVGYLRYEVERAGRELPPWAVAGLAAGGALLMLLSAVTLAALRHKSSQAEREYKRIQLQMDTLENSVRSECKQAFAELQTDMCDLNHELQATGIPLLDHRTYIMKIFFPGVLNNPIIQEFKPINGPQTNYEVAMAQFEQLLYNRNFLLTFVECLERQKTFTIRDKVNVSSLLMIILLAKMEYAKEILKELLLRLVEKYLETKHPQLMLRRAESVVEKLLTNWMALCMYSYIKEHVGKSLFLLFSAIKHQVEKGPVDAITSDARYSLSEERLLREPIDYRVVTVQVIQEEQDEKIVCRVNDCDTISQVKNKILDAVYKNTPFSQRPSIHDVDLGTLAYLTSSLVAQLHIVASLQWRHGRGGHLILDDDDLTSKVSGNWQRLNTLAHYGIKDVAVMGLVHRNRNGPMSLPGSASLGTASKTHNVRYWHLVKPVEDHQPKEHSHKAILEIFLTRLLSTKGTIQKFVDDFLTSILTVNEHLPPAIKWLFDLLDEAALRHGISDPEVLHAWKSNSFPLRFWVLLIKNPDYVFDIDKTPTVDSCLSVIAQTFMDACSTAEHRLGKVGFPAGSAGGGNGTAAVQDSPSNKLLFARDLVTYRQRVTRFYQDVAAMPPVSDQHLAAFLGSLSMSHAGEIDSLNALKELYIYVTKYGSQIVDSLEQEPNCQRMARQLSSILIEEISRRGGETLGKQGNSARVQ
ncbi:plexB [Cordylochernes scorpioides]|uniref:PlexB n=1 Tax=Cordylochernes scorpioides TaxID=51811 RepID=A0ABY6K393_9ARAC|nr:plexB [Cordylochernes scorpioides]